MYTLRKSKIVYLNAEEAFKVCEITYNGKHSPVDTKAIASRFKLLVGSKSVVITDEARPITYSDEADKVSQISIPKLESPLSEQIYSLLGQKEKKVRVTSPTGCGDTFAPAFQLSEKITELNTSEHRLRFALFWSSVVYRTPGSNLKDLPDDIMHDLMCLCCHELGIL